MINDTENLESIIKIIEKKKKYDDLMSEFRREMDTFNGERVEQDKIKQKYHEKRRILEKQYVDQVKSLRNKIGDCTQKRRELVGEANDQRKKLCGKIDEQIESFRGKIADINEKIRALNEKKKNMASDRQKMAIQMIDNKISEFNKQIEALKEKKREADEKLNAEKNAMIIEPPSRPDSELNPDNCSYLKKLQDEIRVTRELHNENNKEIENLTKKLEEFRVEKTSIPSCGCNIIITELQKTVLK